jgi:ferritin-like metal-binding protein YciE
MESMRELLIEELSDLYSAEKQLVEALPKMAKAASSEKLRAAFEEHLTVTEGHVQRLEDAFQELETKPKRKKCKAMVGLIEEGAEIIKEKGIPEIKDVALIGAAQRVEHYEIAAYGTSRAIAESLELANIAELLQQTLDEEREADTELNNLALNEVNAEAVAASE